MSEEVKSKKVVKRPASYNKKKELLIEQLKNGLFIVRYEGGGKLPAELSGVFTNKNELENKVAHYKSKKEK